MTLAAAPIEETWQLSFEGIEVEGMRYSLAAINGVPPRPLRIGERIRITLEAEVESVVHYGAPATRLHKIKLVEGEEAHLSV